MLSGISIWQLLIILLIVVMIFGTKKLRNMGGDLGGAVRSFKKAMNEDAKIDGEQGIQSNKPLEHQSAEQADADFTQTKEQEKR
ncbi:MAG: Sec-independent protein translocase subunit TatA [Venatoribacter sp.]